MPYVLWKLLLKFLFSFSFLFLYVGKGTPVPFQVGWSIDARYFMFCFCIIWSLKIFVGYCLKKLWSGTTKLSNICNFFSFFQECIACYQFIFFEQLEVSFAKCSITVYANTAECFLNLLFQSCIGVAVSLRIIWCIIVSPISQGHYLYYLLCT